MSDRQADVDADLVARARAGDIEAWRVLFERHREAAYRVAWRILSHAEDALDAVQDAFVRAFENLGGFDGRSSFRTWLLRIVANRAIDVRRARRVRVVQSLDAGRAGESGTEVAVAAESGNPAAPVEEAELAERIRQAVASLPEGQRVVVELYSSGEMTYEEIAEVLGIPVGTVMSRLFHARKKLRERLGPVLAEMER